MAAMAFPCRLEAGLGRFHPLTELEEIAQSVRMILTTRRSERPFRPEFGARLDRFSFENIDTTTCTLIRHEVLSALHAWEPRIWNIEVMFDRRPREGVLIVLVSYQVRGTGARGREEIRMETA